MVRAGWSVGVRAAPLQLVLSPWRLVALASRSHQQPLECPFPGPPRCGRKTTASRVSVTSSATTWTITYPSSRLAARCACSSLWRGDSECLGGPGAQPPSPAPCPGSPRTLPGTEHGLCQGRGLSPSATWSWWLWWLWAAWCELSAAWGAVLAKASASSPQLQPLHSSSAPTKTQPRCRAAAALWHGHGLRAGRIKPPSLP